MSVREQPAATSSNRRASIEGLSMAPALSRAAAAFQAVSRVGASVMATAWRGFVPRSSGAAPERRPSGAVVATMQKRTGARGGLGLWGAVGAVAGGLAAGAGAAHLLYRHGHKYGLELRPPRPAPPRAHVPTPEDFEAREPGRGRLAQRPEHIPHKGWIDIFWRVG